MGRGRLTEPRGHLADHVPVEVADPLEPFRHGDEGTHGYGLAHLIQGLDEGLFHEDLPTTAAHHRANVGNLEAFLIDDRDHLRPPLFLSFARFAMLVDEITVVADESRLLVSLLGDRQHPLRGVVGMEGGDADVHEVRLAFTLPQGGQALPQRLGKVRDGGRSQPGQEHGEFGAIEAIGPRGGRRFPRAVLEDVSELPQKMVSLRVTPGLDQVGEGVDAQGHDITQATGVKEMLQVGRETALVIEPCHLVEQQLLVEAFQLLVHGADYALDLAGHEIHGFGDLSYFPRPGQWFDTGEPAPGDVARQLGDVAQRTQGEAQHQKQQEQRQTKGRQGIGQGPAHLLIELEIGPTGVDGNGDHPRQVPAGADLAGGRGGVHG